jgi:hypothetical protein
MTGSMKIHNRKWYGYDHRLDKGRWKVCEPLPLEADHAQQIAAARPGGLRDHLRKLLAAKGTR